MQIEKSSFGKCLERLETIDLKRFIFTQMCDFFFLSEFKSADRGKNGGKIFCTGNHTDKDMCYSGGVQCMAILVNYCLQLSRWPILLFLSALFGCAMTSEYSKLKDNDLSP